MKHITISFRPDDDDLYQWFMSLIKRWSDKSYLGRDALKIYRLFDGDIIKVKDALDCYHYMIDKYGDDWQAQVYQEEL